IPVGVPTMVRLGVPSLIVIVPEKPDLPCVHWVCVSAPIVGAALILRSNVPLASTPALSWTLIWIALKSPVAVGVPLIVIAFPLRLADSPVGSPLTFRFPSGPVPPVIVMALV